jgi:hypothetical protein
MSELVCTGLSWSVLVCPPLPLQDVSDLERRCQAAEARHQELAAKLPDTTRPLLRQMEAMQVRVGLHEYLQVQHTSIYIRFLLQLRLRLVASWRRVHDVQLLTLPCQNRLSVECVWTLPPPHTHTHTPHT